MFEVVEIEFAFSINKFEVGLALCTHNLIGAFDAIVSTLFTILQVRIIKLIRLAHSTTPTDPISAINTVTSSILYSLVDRTVGRLARLCDWAKVMGEHTFVTRLGIRAGNTVGDARNTRFANVIIILRRRTGGTESIDPVSVGFTLASSIEKGLISSACGCTIAQ